jgi:hypothetical protein
LIERFALIVGRDVEYVVAGKSSARRERPPARTAKRGADAA